MTRMRSPNFPAIPLAQAIDLTAKIFKEDRSNVIQKEDAARHMGYSGLTGRTLKLMGALSQFGLLDKAAKGQVRVSKTAVEIIHPSDDEERRAAIARAGRSPTLFRRISGSFDNPSDRTITSFLVREGFTDRAIPPVLKSYRATNAFLAANGVTDSYGNEGADGRESSDDEEEEAVNEQPDKDFREAKKQLDDGGLDLNFDLRSISLSGRTTSPDELREFVKKLQALQPVFEQFALKESAEEG